MFDKERILAHFNQHKRQWKQPMQGAVRVEHINAEIVTQLADAVLHGVTMQKQPLAGLLQGMMTA